MRLINCKSLQLEEFFNSNTPKYAILSHTWDRNEVSFAEFTTDLTAAKTKRGFEKIYCTCQQALADGLDFAWVDTVCIDKSSSAELSEAINSMYKWYADASVCYVYLLDVVKDGFATEFSQSRWFERGWTLQELIAPKKVVFYDRSWVLLGSKVDHVHLIHEITRIDEEVLMNDTHEAPLLNSFCVAKRMAWASQRKTTREEDMAYCLLGIFGVNMPLLYGEGERAFYRLQLEIIRVVDDDSILAWGRQAQACDSVTIIDIVTTMSLDLTDHDKLLADSPKDFSSCHDIMYSVDSISPYAMTNQGLSLELPMIQVSRDSDIHSALGKYVGLLTCTRKDTEALFGILLAGGHEKSSHKHRLAIESRGEEPGMTLLVDPRWAADAVPIRFTITNLLRSSQVARGRERTHKHVLVNVSARNHNFTYIPRRGKIFHFDEAYSYPSTWDHVSRVLTIKKMAPRPLFDCINFTFESTCKDSQRRGFTILVLGPKAVVRKDPSLSVEEERSCFQWMYHNEEEEEDVVITTDDGRQFILVVTVQDSVLVHNWEMVTVHLDPFEITGLSGHALEAERRYIESQRGIVQDDDS